MARFFAGSFLGDSLVAGFIFFLAGPTFSAAFPPRAFGFLATGDGEGEKTGRETRGKLVKKVPTGTAG